MHNTEPVNRLMSTPVLSIGPDDQMSKLLDLFLTHPIHHVPVIDGDARVVGIVSSADIMKLKFFLPNGARSSIADHWQVRRLMAQPVITVTEHEPIDRCIDLMAANGVHALPVVDSSARLVGILTTTDVMRLCVPPTSSTQAAESNSGAPSLSDDRIANAVACARRAVNANQDPHHIAAALLHAQQRIAALQTVVTAAKRYMHAGQDERLHVALAKALERADRFDEASRNASVLGFS